MKSITVIAGTFVGALLLSSAASAKEYTIEVTPDHRKCYQVEYVPATVLVNTKGKLVEGPKKVWEGDVREHGAIVVKRKVPAVYKSTRRVIEEDHYTLHKVSCCTQCGD